MGRTARAEKVAPKFANYYFLLLVFAAFVILVFTRLNNSRIGRGWVAIREDEKAAEAMGVNVFGLKLFAFASGAFLAGVAGAVKAHQDISVTPDQYVFLESAFLLAAVVLGGMGTVLGVLVGALIVVMVGVLFATGNLGSNTSTVKVELPKVTTGAK